MGYADPRPGSLASNYSGLPKRAQPAWPGTERAQWIQSKRSLTPAALALVLAVVRTYGGPHPGLTRRQLDTINRVLGETEEMAADDFESLLSEFDKAEMKPPQVDALGLPMPRSLSAMGYSAYVLFWLEGDFNEGVRGLYKLGVHEGAMLSQRTVA